MLCGRHCDIINLLALAEPRTYRFLTEHCRGLKSGTLLDIKNHVRMYTVAVAKLGFNMVAVEPSLDTLAILERNNMFNQLESRAVFINVTLADEDAERILYLLKQHADSDFLFKPKEYIGEVKVKTTGLQSLPNRFEQQLDITKVDAAGAERYIFERLRKDGLLKSAQIPCTKLYAALGLPGTSVS